MNRRQPPQTDAWSAAAAGLPPIAREQLHLTGRQRQLVRNCCDRISAATGWRGDLPVLLLDRCWLRLSQVPVEALSVRLPPDCSREAPELVRFRELLSGGLSALEAEQLCWLDFGMEACRQAQRRFWQGQERGNRGWTLERYLTLLQEYRKRLDQGSQRPLPLLVLARPGGAPADEEHRLVWLGAEDGREQERPMRHTCA